TATEQAAQTATDLAPDWLRHEAAPSMAFARLANENRLGTRFADSLPKWSAEFSAFIDSALDRKTFETWINRPELTAVTWVEFEFARRALRTSLPDDVVRDLIRAIRDRAILVTDPSCTTTADARGPDPVWQSFLAETLRVQRELDRQVIDDIRIDKAQASKLAATGKGLLDRLQTIQQAEASLMRLASQAESICGFPVKRFPERHDPVIGLFNKANSLRNLLADRAATTASIEAQWKDFKQDFATLRISSPDNASWDVSEITKIRHSRYSLASRFQNPSGGLTSTQRLSVSLRAMAEQCVRDRSDGNLAERMRRANFVDSCRRLVMQLRQHDSGIPAWDIWVPQRVVNQAEVAGDDLPGNGSFTDKTITVALVARASGGGAPVAGRWTWDCDSKDWFIESASSEHIPRDQQHGRMDLTVRATTTSPRSAILIGRWVTNDDCYRVDVPLVGRKPDFLDWRLRVPSQAGDDPGAPQHAWMMAPNEVETRSLWLRNRDEGVQEVSVRWIAPEDSSGEKPRVLAELAKLPVPVDHEIRVPFPPRKLPPKSPPVSVSQLQIEMVDLATGRVQRNTITPSVRRPFSLLRPRVDFDASTQLVTVHVDPGDAAGSGPIDQVKTMDVTLRRTRDGKAVAQGQWRGNGSSVPSLRLSAAAAAREAFDVIIAVNQWPHSFCYSITAQQSVSDAVVKESEFDVYFLEADPVLVGTRDETLHVSIGCGISDPSFAYGHDKLILGIDGNGDRYLTPDETQQILSQPVDISLHFAGVDPAGNLQVGNTVVDAKFPLRTKDLVDGRHSLLACLRQGETETMSTARELIVDRQPPTLARLEVENDSPLVSGQVASFRIRGSDAGLSGVQTVKIAWSQDGKMELPSKPPPVSCVQNEVGDWIGQLPTAGRPPGMWTVLAIATDRVGNASEIKTRVVQVWTAEQLAAQRRRQVGSVAGRVIYADVPVPNLSVKLSPVIDSDNKPSPETAGKTSGASDKTSGNANVRSAAVHTQTDAQGRYQFQDVPPGRYEIQLHGIYRGMTRRQATRIDVAPQQVQRLPDMVIR
ncbi:MAG: carboxypeptidase-like regulatory domain-containing protein, partial [Planctomycetota bacterium]